MGNFTFTESHIKGLIYIERKIYPDERGCFMETYNKRDFIAAGINKEFVQENHSCSKKHILRGLHFQNQFPQGKLVCALRGEVFDVSVDFRYNSPTFGKWYGVVLSEAKGNMLYVPEGFAHGYLALSDDVLFSYFCTDYYHPEDEGGIIWNDPDLAIDWPLSSGILPVLSEKDMNHPTLKQSGILDNNPWKGM
jgi:dTDP-4-dehydrorhamnose 3,5-epimerase